MNYSEFEKMYLGKRIDFDNFPRVGRYQCVDLIKLWLWKIHNWKVWTIWNANQIYYNKYKIFGKDWIRVNGDYKQWDIIISTKWKYGHIAIVKDWDLVLEQNGVGWWTWLWWNAIRLKSYPKTFWRWARRFIW